MALPLLHTAVATAAVLPFVVDAPKLQRNLTLAFTAVASIAPDFDFAAVWVLGMPDEAWHRTATHSLVATLVVGLLAAALARGGSGLPRPSWLGAATAWGWGSHLAIDLVTTDTREPVGLMLAWPFSYHFFAGPALLPAGIQHTAEGVALLLGTESGIATMALGLSWAVARRRTGRGL